jgi:Bacterial DNA-binding protein
LRDFGVFTTKMRDARTAHNPRSGERVDIESKRHAFFKAGRGILKRINQAKSPCGFTNQVQRQWLNSLKKTSSGV